MKISEWHLAHWREHGYVLVEDFLSSERLAAAQTQIAAIFPRPRCMPRPPTCTEPTCAGDTWSGSRIWETS
jgi:hypothetical protein